VTIDGVPRRTPPRTAVFVPAGEAASVQLAGAAPGRLLEIEAPVAARA
jgi:hypothetical protein